MIVVAGEALIDLTVEPTGAIHAHPGGGPFNVARTLGRLGAPVTYIGRLSHDRFGARLRAALVADGVPLDGVVDTDAPTTLAVAELDETGTASYRFYLDGTSALGLDVETALDRLPADATALHIGTLGLVLPPSADAVRALAERVSGRALVLVDPNCRPAVGDGPAAVRLRLEAVLGLADVVKASDDDLAWLAPGVTPVAAARALLAGGPAVVLLTRGGAGVTIVTATATVDVPAPKIEVVVDTIGAGDAFGGAFLSHCHDAGFGRDAMRDLAAVEAATRFAVTIAARTCERAGADPPWRRELDARH